MGKEVVGYENKTQAKELHLRTSEHGIKHTEKLNKGKARREALSLWGLQSGGVQCP